MQTNSQRILLFISDRLAVPDSSSSIQRSSGGEQMHSTV